MRLADDEAPDGQLLPWQGIALGVVESAALAHGALRVQPFGSIAGGDADEWSDLDAMVVVPDSRLSEFWPDRAWIPSFGSEVVKAKHWRAPSSGATTQLLLADGRHIDVMVVEESLADQCMASLADLRPLADRSTVEELAGVLIFDATDVVKRAARGERLIATHLALGLFGRCVEAAMVIRDLATGTCIHPRPAAEDALIDHMPAIPAAPQPKDLLAMVTAALDCFEDMLVGTTLRPATFSREVVDQLITRAEQDLD